jgi:hypothetical protein
MQQHNLKAYKKYQLQIFAVALVAWRNPLF